MWEAVKEVFTSGNAVFVLATILILVVVLAILAKTGIVKLDIKGLQVGPNDEDERAIIRQQTEWVQLYLQSMERLPVFDGLDTYHTKYVIEKMFDEVLSWIVFNHISDSETYISIKQEKVWNLAITMITEKSLISEEFKTIVYEATEKVVKRLVYIRKNYHK